MTYDLATPFSLPTPPSITNCKLLILSRMNSQAQEWLETGGQGGFASGTASDVRKRQHSRALVSA
jgi:hypothetical protein